MARTSAPQPFVESINQPRSFLFELCLAATAFFAWLLAGCYQIRVGVGLEQVRVVLADPQWYPQWPAGPWALAVLALLGALWQRRLATVPEAALGLRLRLRHLSLLTGALLVLRVAALLNPVSALFPYLGLLWAPHAAWALGATYLFYLNGPLLPACCPRKMAWVLFGTAAVAFLCWAVYFCQMTMLHGDEAHYLRVSQSLLHDGDMDLTNNVGPGPSAEFHVIDFPPHQAPGSPPGRIHSVHPIGLSALLVPAYWTGLHLWANPRLAASLLMALIGAGAVALVFVWLVRLGFDRWHALACALVGGTTTPFFLFVPQLYPEIPALLIALVVLSLLFHWQLPAGRYQPLGTREPLLLAGLGALVFSLLFLHPRYLPLALFLGAGVVLQARSRPDPLPAWRLLAGVGSVAALGLVAFNYAYSNDLFGPFMPGNAWEQGALSVSTWFFSLPGHWLHTTTGLLNSSPVFVASALGLVLLARQPGPQRLAAAAFYLVTAGVNGLHPDWTFGFCPPARFLLTALPLLLLGLAWFLRATAGRVAALFPLLLALALSYDSIAAIAGVPEQAFGGNHLSVRTLDEYYPLDMHFFSEREGAVPWGVVGFWLLMAAGLSATLVPALAPRWRRAAVLGAALLPFVWGQAGALGPRLREAMSPYILQLNAAGHVPPGVQYFDRQISSEYQMTTGHSLKMGGYGAQAPANPAGILKSFYAPLMQPGVLTYTLKGAYAEHGAGQLAGHFSVVQRRALPAIADWGVYHHQTLAAAPAPTEFRLNFPTDQTGLAYAYVEFAGVGSLAFKEVNTRFLPLRLGSRPFAVADYQGGQNAPQRATLSVHCGQLGRGYYRAVFHVRGLPLASFFQRKPAPVYMAVYADQNTPPGGPPLEAQATRWLNEYFAYQDPTPRGDFVRPVVESIQAPWWAAVPFVGGQAFELEFGLTDTQDAWLLFDYNGDAGVQVEGVTLYRIDLTSAALWD